MSDETTDPNTPAARKRAEKAAASEKAAADAAETPLPSGEDFHTPEGLSYVMAASENAIGTLAETKGWDEAAGGDPNSPADRALESALAHESNLAASIVKIASHIGTPNVAAEERAAEEYPGELDPTEEPQIEHASNVEAPVDPRELERVVEALLFAAMEPITVREIARAADSSSAVIRKVLIALKETGDREHRPWELVEVANAYRFVTRPEFHPAIQRLKTQTSQRKLTQAALETLALIAYRQPIGRAEIESVRGVNAGPVLRLLLDKKLIQISGRGTGVGQPLLYATTDYFLENFGIKNVSELPKPGEFKNA